jgi:hypothetical protein
MAAAVVLPSASQAEPGSCALVAANLPITSIGTSVDAEKVVSCWLATFQKVIESRNFEELQKLFLRESYWRDQLCLSWNFRKSPYSGPSTSQATMLTVICQTL